MNGLDVIVQVKDDLDTLTQAHRRAWRETVQRIEDARDSITDQNFGVADDLLSSLLDDLPHDFGAQDITPMLDRYVEEILEYKKK